MPDSYHALIWTLPQASVMPLLIRKITYVVYKLEYFAKVGKLKGLRDVVLFDSAAGEP